ncbi:MAG: N-acetyltransferase [Deltaproteobacteria bacterium]|nr:N-acetyltransferase [Deltaproteobacteria bacterium]
MAAILNGHHNEVTGENAVFFGFFECIQDQEVANALLDTVLNWGKKKGLTLLKGPTSPTINDDSGLLIEGFDSSPYIMMSYNPRYYQNLFKNYGLSKAKDLFAYFMDVTQREVYETQKIVELSQVVREREKVTVRNVSLKGDIEKDLQFAYEIYNSGWSKNWGYVPMTLEDIRFLIQSLKSVAILDFTFIVEAGGVPVGLCFAIPNLNEILKNIHGRLLPFGWWKLLRGFKKVSSLRVFALGVKKEYHARGLGVVCYHELMERTKKYNFTESEQSWILEDNHMLNKAMEHMGAFVYKRYRIFEKKI